MKFSRTKTQLSTALFTLLLLFAASCNHDETADSGSNSGQTGEGLALRTVNSPDEIFPLPLLDKGEAVQFAHTLYLEYRDLLKTPSREVRYELAAIDPSQMELKLSEICLAVRDKTNEELQRTLELDELSGTTPDILQQRRVLMWLALSLEYDRSEPDLDENGDLVEVDPEYVDLCGQ